MYPFDEAVEYYGRKFNEAENEQGFDLSQILSDIVEGEELKETRYKKIALVLGQVLGA